MDKSTANKNVLNTIYQTADMGVHAIDKIFDAIKDDRLIVLILKQKDKYEEVSNKCQKMATKYGYNIDTLSGMAKMGSTISIKMKSAFNNTMPHLCEMLIQGTTMGITTLLKCVGENTTTDEKTRQLAQDLQTAMEEFVDSLKTLIVK